MHAYEIPGNQFSLLALTAIPQYRFVSVNNKGEAVLAKAGSVVVGVSSNEVDPVRYPDGQVVDVIDGIVMVEAAEVIAAGAPVTTDADGKAVAATDGSFVGVAFTGATAAGHIISVKMVSGQIIVEEADE